ncbi:MAG: ATP-dependent zinc protease [Desulfomonile tiedjei]|nr:ATP-dependent zinc protease [Desulfomonile tiedjei]
MKSMSWWTSVLVVILLAPAAASAAQKQVVGGVEKAVILPENIVLDAKVDTGADNTSLDARHITAIDRDGIKMLRFTVDTRQGRTVTIESEQVGIEIVPQHDGEDVERPLIVLEVCLGKQCRRTLVNLTDRSGRKYPLLIGRSFMLDRIIVDPSREYLTGHGGRKGSEQ